MKHSNNIERTFDLIELAGIYIQDGAPRTAASRLRDAAKLLDQQADALDAILASGGEEA